jgi:hypothetical protein
MDFLAKAEERGFSFVRFQDFLPDSSSLPQRYIALVAAGTSSVGNAKLLYHTAHRRRPRA